MKRERERQGRIKTNPLGELVLVAMATIITSHLGEQEQGERRGGGGGEKGRKTGWRLEYEGRTREEEKCQIHRKCAEMSERGGKVGSVNTSGTTFPSRDLPPSTQTAGRRSDPINAPDL